MSTTNMTFPIRTGDDFRALLQLPGVQTDWLFITAGVDNNLLSKIRTGEAWPGAIPEQYHEGLDNFADIAGRNAKIDTSAKAKDSPPPKAHQAITDASTSSDLPSPDVEAISRALDFLRPTGNLQLVAIHPSGHPILAATFKMPGEQAAATTWAEEHNKHGMGVYFAANPAKEGVSRKIRKDEVSQVEVAHADIDPNLDKGYAAGRQELVHNTLPKLKADLCSAVIDSGNGLQAIWRYSECPDIEAAEKINQGIIDKYSGDQGTHDVSRILRLPGTLNYPNKKKLEKGYPPAPSLAKLLYISDERQSAEQLAQRFPGGRPNPTTDSHSLATESIDEQALKDKINHLAEQSPKFKNRFTGSTEGLRDNSRSGMDMSIGASLKAAGFTYPEVAHTLLHLFKHGKGGENTERDIQRIWTNAATTSSDNEWPALQPFNTWDDIPDNPYPTDALGQLLGSAVRAFAKREGVHPSLIAQSVLAASAAVLQPRFNVVCSRYTTPLSQFLLALAGSGTGKSQAEEFAFASIEAGQKRNLAAYRQARQEDPDTPLRSPVFFIKSMTTAGLLRTINERSPHVIVQHADGMAFLGSHAFKEGRSNETVSTLCDLWSGRPAILVQGHMEEILHASDRRVSLSLAIQPEFSSRFLLNRELEAQGLLPRSLIVFPQPALHLPSFESQCPKEEDHLSAFQQRIEEFLDIPVLMDQSSGEIDFRPLTMDRQAFQLWRQLAQGYKQTAFNRKDGLGPYYERAAEHIRRLAGIIALMDGNDFIESCHIANAERLLTFYMEEWSWMRAKLRAHGDYASQAQELWNWMRSRHDTAGEATFNPTDVNRGGPRICRNNITLTRTLFDELVDRGFLRQEGKLYHMRPPEVT